jgi:hypothetical protein
VSAINLSSCKINPLPLERAQASPGLSQERIHLLPRLQMRCHATKLRCNTLREFDFGLVNATPWLSSCPTFEKLHVSNRRAAVTQLDYCFAARHGAFSGRDKLLKLHSLQHCRRAAAQDIFRGVPLSSNEAPYARARTSSRDNRDEENRRIGLDTHTVQLRFARCNGLRSQSSAPTRS